MKILEQLVPPDYDLILFGDNQEGNVAQHKTGYKEVIQRILDTPKCFAIHMGDDIEAYWVDDPRYSPYTMDKSVLDQQGESITDLQPIAKKGKLISLLYGNHAHRLFPKIGDITESTCKRLGIKYGGFSCVISFIDKKGLQFKGFFTHGRKLISSVADDPIRRKANEELQLKRHLERKVGDSILMAKGHTHKLIVAEPHPQVYLTTENEEIHQFYTASGGEGYIHPDHRWYVNTGSFLKTFQEDVITYSEVSEYDPIEIGYILVTVRDRIISSVQKVTI